MRFETIIPTDRLKPYVKKLVISENEVAATYKVFPTPSLVIGFQYKGSLSHIIGKGEVQLSNAGITGLGSSYKTFSNTAGIGTVLVYFTEVGLAHFTSCPANELFNLSISLHNIFNGGKLRATEDKLHEAKTDRQRIHIVEQFLLSQLKNVSDDKLVIAAVRRIYSSQGYIRIIDLCSELFISQSPLEKRFRKLVGTTPKKFASIVRFISVLDQLKGNKSLAEICYENNFFDQAHFIKDFRQYTGTTPQNFGQLP